ncbi:MAG: hypothetical protein WA949_23320 [Phormidesmis sp.]
MSNHIITFTKARSLLAVVGGKRCVRRRLLLPSGLLGAMCDDRSGQAIFTAASCGNCPGITATG